MKKKDPRSNYIPLDWNQYTGLFGFFEKFQLHAPNCIGILKYFREMIKSIEVRVSGALTIYPTGQLANLAPTLVSVALIMSPKTR